jgi:hypothetical protein
MPSYASFNLALSLCMIMAVIALLVVMLTSYKLGTSPAMPSWGKLSTLHFLVELVS